MQIFPRTIGIDYSGAETANSSLKGLRLYLAVGEDRDLLEAIVYNDDNLTYGSSISVYTGQEESITALTDDGIEEMADMIRAARLTTQTWHDFLDDFVEDPELVTRIKAKSPR